MEIFIAEGCDNRSLKVVICTITLSWSVLSHQYVLEVIQRSRILALSLILQCIRIKLLSLHSNAKTQLLCRSHWVTFNNSWFQRKPSYAAWYAIWASWGKSDMSSCVLTSTIMDIAAGTIFYVWWLLLAWLTLLVAFTLTSGHAKLISCFWSCKSLKNDQATRLFLLFLKTFFGNQSWKKMVYKQQNASWRVRSGDKTTKCRHLCIQGAKI